LEVQLVWVLPQPEEVQQVIKGDDMKDQKETRRKLPKFVWFMVFFGLCFLPGLLGKISATLTGMILSLYLLGLMQGKKRYVLAVVLPVIACISIRLVSNCIYGWIVDVESREEAIRKVCVVKDSVVHYVNRIYETVSCFEDSVSKFHQTWEFKYLKPVFENSQFILILLIMVICVISVFLDKKEVS